VQAYIRENDGMAKERMMAWRKGKANNFKFYTTTYIYAAHFNREGKKKRYQWLKIQEAHAAVGGICTVGVLFVRLCRVGMAKCPRPGPGPRGCLRLIWASKERKKAAGRVVFTVGET